MNSMDISAKLLTIQEKIIIGDVFCESCNVLLSVCCNVLLRVPDKTRANSHSSEAPYRYKAQLGAIGPNCFS